MHRTNYNIYNIKYYILNTVSILLCTYSFSQDIQDIQIANEYLNKGEKEKAFLSFQVLAKNPLNISSIHSNYFNLLLDLRKFKQAEDYVEKLIKRDDKISYKLDLGVIFFRAGEQTKADKYIRAIVKALSEDSYKIKSVSDYFAAQNLIDYAVLSFLQARITQGNPTLFTLELANLYRIQGKRDDMVNEYLNYISQMPSNISYVKNLMQILLTKPEELESLENLLTERIQHNQNSEIFSDLLIWVNLQQKNFYNAFVQSRAYDRRFHKEQSKTLEIAQISLNNNDYPSADKAFSFVVREFANTDNYIPARLGLIKTREAKVKKSFPINTDSVHYVINEYERFSQQYPDHPGSFDARLNQAMLHAYYLNDLDSSILKLNALIANTKTSAVLKAQAKIDLGDIFLLKEEPWEATLLYSQVEKSQRESTLGYEAKLRNAKLSYYEGDFKLAQEHLDILKQATTREIANDAMQLSMLIKENTAFDSVGSSLREYAEIELLIAQNKIDQALYRLKHFTPKIKIETTKLQVLKPKLGERILRQKDNKYELEIADTVSGPSINIKDDVYWLEANLLMRKGEFKQSIETLEKILVEYPTDILADDAYFLQAEIYERQLKNKEKAMEMYREFLTKFSSSVYAAEARKRFRQLRGDFNAPNQ